MKALEARITALESLKPAPRIAFVARYLEDGSLVPLPEGRVYGRSVALIAEPYKDVGAWLKRFTADGAWEREREIMAKAEKVLEKNFNARRRDGPGKLAEKNAR